MEKHKFKTDRLCSSDNYELSKKLHRGYLKKEHDKNIIFIQEITKTTIIKRHAYVSCFGKLIAISEERAEILKETNTIIYK